jgi:hypothetical protein
MAARSTPAATAQALAAAFDQRHQDPECGPATARQAAQARTRNERWTSYEQEAE